MAETSRKQYEESGFLTKTSNGTGWQMNALDEFGETFLQFAKTCKKPILDLGVAYGYTSKQLLKTGVQVIANDLSAEMLTELRNSITDEERSRLQILPGNVMALEFDDQTFDGIWANRFFHFLKPEEIRKIIAKCYDWLTPGGKLCITAASQFFLDAAPFLPVYENRKQSGEEWPGMMWKNTVPGYVEADVDMSIPFFHFLDTDVLKREVELAGFTMEKLSYIARPYNSNNGKEGSGLIAVKPTM